jgi:hypothetical protein
MCKHDRITHSIVQAGDLHVAEDVTLHNRSVPWNLVTAITVELV